MNNKGKPRALNFALLLMIINVLPQKQINCFIRLLIYLSIIVISVREGI